MKEGAVGQSGIRPRVSRFEDLVAWQHARSLCREVYSATSRGPLARDHALRDQMRRAVASILANIAEGFERGRRTEFHQFLSIAKGSCAELRSFLYIAADTSAIDVATFTRLMELALSVTRLVARLRSAVAAQRERTRR